MNFTGANVLSTTIRPVREWEHWGIFYECNKQTVVL